MTLLDDLFQFGADNYTAGGSTPPSIDVSTYASTVAPKRPGPPAYGQGRLDYQPASVTHLGPFNFVLTVPAAFCGTVTWTDADGETADIDVQISAPRINEIYGHGAPATYEVTVYLEENGTLGELLTQFVPQEVAGSAVGGVVEPAGIIVGGGNIILPGQAGQPMPGVLTMVLADSAG